MNPYAQFLAQQFSGQPPQPPPPPPDNPFARFLASILTVPSEVVNKTRGALDKFGAPSREALANLQDPATGRINPEAAKTLAMDFGGVTGTVGNNVSKAVFDDMISKLHKLYKKQQGTGISDPKLWQEAFDAYIDQFSKVKSELGVRVPWNYKEDLLTYDHWLKAQPKPGQKLFHPESKDAANIVPRKASGFDGPLAPSPLTPGLDLSELGRAQRADDLGFITDVFHHTKSGNVFSQFQPKAFGDASYHDMAGVHVGSEKAAGIIGRSLLKRRLGDHPLNVIGEDQIKDLAGPTMMLKLNLDNALYGDSQLFKDLLPQSYGVLQASGTRVLPESHLDGALRAMANKVLPGPYMKEADKMEAMRKFLLDEGYEVLPYVNQIEDAGSVSYNVLEPNNLRFRDAMFDPARRYDRNLMGGLAPLPFIMEAMKQKPDSTKTKRP